MGRVHGRQEGTERDKKGQLGTRRGRRELEERMKTVVLI